MKTCSKCKKEKENENFTHLKTSKDKLSYHCKECTKLYREENKENLQKNKKEYYSRPEIRERDIIKCRDNYIKNKTEMQLQMKNYYMENRDRYLYNKCKERCKRDNIQFDIDLSDISIPEYCPILGIKLTSVLGNGQLETNASLDRIDPAKGYIKGNVQVMSRKANTMKSNATKEELIAFGEWCRSLTRNV